MENVGISLPKIYELDKIKNQKNSQFSNRKSFSKNKNIMKLFEFLINYGTTKLHKFQNSNKFNN